MAMPAAAVRVSTPEVMAFLESKGMPRVGD